MTLPPAVVQRQSISDPQAYWSARIVNASTVWSPTLRRDVYVSPREYALLVWLRADGWRRTTNRAVASMFGVSPGTVARWMRTLVSLGVIAHLSARGRAGWTRLRRDARTFVVSMHAPQIRSMDDVLDVVVTTRTVVRALAELVGPMPWLSRAGSAGT